MTGFEKFIIVYVSVTVLIVVTNYVDFRLNTESSDRKRSARIILLSPIWPVLGVLIVTRELAKIVRSADWKNRT